MVRSQRYAKRRVPFLFVDVLIFHLYVGTAVAGIQADQWLRLLIAAPFRFYSPLSYLICLKFGEGTICNAFVTYSLCSHFMHAVIAQSV
jgi:hypothetical protein